jgi:hypothetical protein
VADPTVVARAAARRSNWARLSPTSRRRILLGSLFGVALAARDVVLLLFAAGFFTLGELAPAPRALPRSA